MIVAFDFDGVLDKKKVQLFAKKLIKENNEVWVVTARKDSEYNKSLVLPVLKQIGLSSVNVIYTDEKDKMDFLIGINADMYIDNQSTEFYNIKNYTNVLPVLYHD